MQNGIYLAGVDLDILGLDTFADRPTIRAVQQALRDVAASLREGADRDTLNPGKLAGVWGPNTERAIRSFERRGNQSETGKVTPWLLAAMGIARTVPGKIATYRGYQYTAETPPAEGLPLSRGSGEAPSARPEEGSPGAASASVAPPALLKRRGWSTWTRAALGAGVVAVAVGFVALARGTR